MPTGPASPSLDCRLGKTKSRNFSLANSPALADAGICETASPEAPGGERDLVLAQDLGSTEKRSLLSGMLRPGVPEGLQEAPGISHLHNLRLYQRTPAALLPLNFGTCPGRTQ